MRSKFDLTFATASLIALIVSIAFAGKLKFEVNLLSVLFRSSVALFFFLLTLVYTRRDPRIARVLRVAFWLIVFTNVFILPVYFLFRLPLQYQDVAFAAVDHMIYFDAQRIIVLVNKFPAVKDFLNYTYNSLIFMVLAGLLLPAILGQTDKNDEFLFAVVVSVAATIVILPCIQAIGPWVSMPHMKPIGLQTQVTQVLDLLKTGSPITFDLSKPPPLVSLPSWHAIFAVLSAAALSRISILRWIAMIWATVILISCITTGWHYTIDVFAGTITALFAILAARCFRYGVVKSSRQ